MVDVLNPDTLHTSLNQLDGWTGTTDAGIEKTYRHADEASARAFVDRVGGIADRLDHHPDVQIDGATVSLRIISHDAGGVTEACIELARAIDGEPGNATR